MFADASKSLTKTVQYVLTVSMRQCISSSRCKTAKASSYGLKGRATELQYSLLMRINKSPQSLQDLVQLTNVPC